jgi:hypothetical protein
LKEKKEKKKPFSGFSAVFGIEKKKKSIFSNHLEIVGFSFHIEKIPNTALPAFMIWTTMSDREKKPTTQGYVPLLFQWGKKRVINRDWVELDTK